MLKKLFASRKNPYVPGLDKPETLEINLSGSILRIRLPPNSVAGLPPELKGHTIDIYNPKHYTDLSHLEDYQNSRLPYMSLLKRAVSLYGRPWQALDLGMITINALIRRVDTLPQTMSCLVPEHFEQVIVRQLYFSVGPAHVGFVEVFAPMNWKIVSPSTGEQWIYCEALRNFDAREYPKDSYHRACYEAFMFIPLDDQYFLQLTFNVIGYTPEKFSNAATKEIITSIVNSCALQMSASVGKRKLEVNQNRKASYSETRNPETWVYHKWHRGDTSADEPDTVITEFGTPPPKFQC